MRNRDAAGGAIIVVAAIVLAAGCGTLSHGAVSRIHVRSLPSNAEIRVDGALVGHTPLWLRLDSARAHRVELRREGRETREIELTPRVDAGYVVGDVLFTALIGLIVDAVTGSLEELSPDAIDVRLRRAPDATQE